MSSFTGTTNSPGDDATLQLAPKNGAPKFGTLKEAFQRAQADQQSYVDQCNLNYNTRYALWNGQSADGKKHSREGGAVVTPTPWDGASDLRVYLTDNLINKKVAILSTSIRRGNLSATPVEGNDLKRARIVNNFMRWMLETQVPDFDREIELLANYVLEKGVGALGVFWEVTQEKTLLTLKIAEFQASFPDLDAELMLNSPEMVDQIASIFEELYDCGKARAKRMVAELRDEGETSVPIVGKERSRPILRAFNFDSDLFVDGPTTDLESAAGIYRVQYYTPEKLRSMVATEGWDAAWVEKAIELARGHVLTPNPLLWQQYQQRSFVYTPPDRFKNMIGVVFAYQRLSDEDGVPGLYCTIFNPTLPPDDTQQGYAKTGLLGYRHGQYPFVLFRREFLSRRLLDSRGLPEPLKPLQDQIKAHKDARIDAASISVVPPLLYRVGRPPTKWGPGVRMPVSSPDDIKYADRIMPDMNNDQSEDRLSANAKDYCGFGSRDGDPAVLPMVSQHEVDKFLKSVKKALGQVWSLYKQFGSERVFFRVIGLRDADPTMFEKGDPQEEFSFDLTWDVRNLDGEQLTAKIDSIVKLATMLDRNGTTNFDELQQWAMEAVDPNVAERVLQPASVGTAKVVQEVQDDLSKLSAGMNVNMKIGTPPQIALSAVQNWIQGAGDVQQRLQSDKDFSARVEAYVKQAMMQNMQQENRQIGRTGAAMPGPAMNPQ